MILISLKVLFIALSKKPNFSSIIYIKRVYVVALTPFVMILSISTFHQLLVILSFSSKDMYVLLSTIKKDI